MRSFKCTEGQHLSVPWCSSFNRPYVNQGYSNKLVETTNYLDRRGINTKTKYSGATYLSRHSSYAHEHDIDALKGTCTTFFHCSIRKRPSLDTDLIWQVICREIVIEEISTHTYDDEVYFLHETLRKPHWCLIIRQLLADDFPPMHYHEISIKSAFKEDAAR